MVTGARAHLDGVGAHAGVGVLEAGAGARDHALLELRGERLEVREVEALDADVVRLGGLDRGDLGELLGVVLADAERGLDAVEAVADVAEQAGDGSGLRERSTLREGEAGGAGADDGDLGGARDARREGAGELHRVRGVVGLLGNCEVQPTTLLAGLRRRRRCVAH